MEKLKTEFVQQLINLPETGMGYHVVDLEMTDGSMIKNVVILNCKLIKDPLVGNQTIKSQNIKAIKISR